MMKKIALIFAVLISMFLLIACDSITNTLKSGEEHTVTIGNPTPEEILENDQHADIFLLDGVVYQNAEKIEWVQKLDLTIGDKLGEIQKNSNESAAFDNYTATKLPVGTVIYKSNENSGLIMIVMVENKIIRYLGLVEG